MGQTLLLQRPCPGRPRILGYGFSINQPGLLCVSSAPESISSHGWGIPVAPGTAFKEGKLRTASVLPGGVSLLQRNSHLWWDIFGDQQSRTGSKSLLCEPALFFSFFQGLFHYFSETVLASLRRSLADGQFLCQLWKDIPACLWSLPPSSEGASWPEFAPAGPDPGSHLRRSLL